MSLQLAGSSVVDLETAFSEAYGFSEVVWFPYARVAATAFLESARPAEKRAIVAAFSGTPVGAAIRAAGFAATYIDSEKHGYREDRTALEQALRTCPGAIGIATSPFGSQSHNYGVPQPILYDYSLATLTDARPDLKPGDGVLYSMGWKHPLSTIRGGFLCGFDEASAARWRMWRSAKLVDGHLKDDILQTLRLRFGLVNDRPLPVGLPRDWNVLLSTWGYRQAIEKLAQRESLKARRLEQIALYARELAEWQDNGLTLPPSDQAYSHYPVRVLDPWGLRARLIEEGFKLQPPVVSQLLSDFPELRGEVIGDLFNARMLCRQTFNLPLSFDVSERTQKAVIRTVASWMRERGGQSSYCLAHQAVTQ